MADITICTTSTCPSARHCYRANATPSAYGQGYFDFKPDETGKCEHYIKMTSQEPKTYKKVQKVKRV